MKEHTFFRMFVLLLTAAVMCLTLKLWAEPRGDVFIQHNLVSDLPGQAEHRDRNLVNPWGIAVTTCRWAEHFSIRGFRPALHLSTCRILAASCS